MPHQARRETEAVDQNTIETGSRPSRTRPASWNAEGLTVTCWGTTRHVAAAPLQRAIGGQRRHPRLGHDHVDGAHRLGAAVRAGQADHRLIVQRRLLAGGGEVEHMRHRLEHERPSGAQPRLRLGDRQLRLGPLAQQRRGGHRLLLRRQTDERVEGGAGHAGGHADLVERQSAVGRHAEQRRVDAHADAVHVGGELLGHEHLVEHDIVRPGAAQPGRAPRVEHGVLVAGTTTWMSSGRWWWPTRSGSPASSNTVQPPQNQSAPCAPAGERPLPADDEPARARGGRGRAR